MNLLHLSTKSVAESNVFDGLKSFDDLIKQIAKHGKTLSKPGEEAYNDFVGGAFEVYTEFFFRRYGVESNPLLGVKHIEDTSRNKFQAGFDFTYENFSGEPCLLQVKYKSNPFDTFKRDAFYTFIDQCDELDIPKKNRIWFTTQSNAGEEGIFHFNAVSLKNRLRVIGREEQELFIDRDPTFWSDLHRTVAQALVAPSDFIEPEPLWAHQVVMSDACQPILQGEGNGRVICATGGGKTRVILQNVLDGFKLGFNLQVVVAPTIDLLRQHHAYFERRNVFHRDGVSVIHFRTGDECKDNWADIRQSTSVNDVVSWLSPKTIVFVTYASERKFLDGLRDKEIEADVILWDEFHHTVRQDSDQLDHLESLPSTRNLFYSASIKRGRIVSGTDAELYGPVLAEVKYSALRRVGVLVPKIVVKIVHLKDGGKIKGLEKSMKKAAKAENFDLRTATVEAAGMIAAYLDKKKSGFVNAVTFSKAVPICKELVSNIAVRAEISGLLQTVHAGVPSRDRKKIYDAVGASSDSVLCQYSVVKEGIDINPFDTVIFSRNLDVIGTQQAIGRAVRANPEDTKNLKAGLISVDSAEGWKKYSATLYVILHDESDITFKEFLKDLIVKLQFAGLAEDDLAFQDTDDTIHGTGSDDDKWIVPLDKELNKIGVETLRDAVKNTMIELQNQQEYDDDYRALSCKDLGSKLSMLFEEAF
jgi:superfamily II DNA or RNA helicase